MGKKPTRPQPDSGPTEDPGFNPTSKENLAKATPEELRTLAATPPPKPASDRPPAARENAPRKKSAAAAAAAEKSWEKAHKAVGEHRARLRRHKGVCGVHVTPELDANHEPTGKAVITIEVEAKLPEDELRKNQILPGSLEGVTVKVADVRGDVLLGDVDAYRRERGIGPRTRGPAAVGGGPTRSKAATARALAPALAGPVKVGPGIPIISVDSAGGQHGGWGTVSALVLVYQLGAPSPERFFLTCSHVLADSSGPLDNVKVGCLNQPRIGLPPVGTAVSFAEGRGHDSSNDCVIITPNATAEAANEIAVIYLIANPPNSEPPQYIGTMPDGHYFPRRLTDNDVRAGTKVYHLGAKTGGQAFGSVVGVDSDFDGKNTPIKHHLIAIQGPSSTPFVEGGDSGGLVLTKDNNEVVGMIVGLRDDGIAVACHFLDVISFFAGTSNPVDI